jgi:hypothetical protein
MANKTTTIVVRNDYHNTTARVRVCFDADGMAELTERQVRKIRATLCCCVRSCGLLGERGRQDVHIIPNFCGVELWTRS